jgi:hypothetical protein
MAYIFKALGFTTLPPQAQQSDISEDEDEHKYDAFNNQDIDYTVTMHPSSSSIIRPMSSQPAPSTSLSSSTSLNTVPLDASGPPRPHGGIISMSAVSSRAAADMLFDCDSTSVCSSQSQSQSNNTDVLDAEWKQHGIPLTSFVDQAGARPFKCTLCSDSQATYVCRRPMNVACGHAFCRTCLEAYILRQKQTSSTTTLRCPGQHPNGDPCEKTFECTEICISSSTEQYIAGLPFKCFRGCGVSNANHQLTIGMGEEKLREHLMNTCDKRPILCGWCGETVIHCHWVHHRAHVCPGRPVTCKRCENEFKHCDFVAHQSNEPIRCAYYQYCPNGCCQEESTSIEGGHHQTYTTYVERLSEDDIEAHPQEPTIILVSQVAAHRLICPMRRTKCVCGEMLLPREEHDHLEHVCPKRSVNCLVCEQPFPYDELEEHRNSEVGCISSDWCPNLCFCVRGGKYLHHHANLSFEDANQPVDHTVVPHKYRDQHEQVCPNASIKCQVCGEDIRRHAIQAHNKEEKHNNALTNLVIRLGDQVNTLVQSKAAMQEYMEGQRDQINTLMQSNAAMQEEIRLLKHNKRAQ